MSAAAERKRREYLVTVQYLTRKGEKKRLTELVFAETLEQAATLGVDDVRRRRPAFAKLILAEARPGRL